MKRTERILVVDDDPTLCYLLKEELVNEGFPVDIVFDGSLAINKLKEANYDMLLLDLEMKEVSGEEVLKFAKANFPNLYVIVLTGKSEIRTAINCIQLGAYDFLTKPYEFQQLLIIIKRALEHKGLIDQNIILQREVDQDFPSTIVGESKQIRQIIKLAERAAGSDSNILLEGETGTGKELFAEFVHKNSQRNKKPLVTINCASLPDQLIESELFGHEKGAFTDAKQSKKGLVEIADGGTLFLDEIGELSLSLQPKLLRFLEKGDFRRVGGVANLSSNVRVIGATNKNLMEEAENKTFRRDLLFRLNVITLTIPALRLRENDPIVLANYFLKKKTSIRAPKQLARETEDLLLEYSWPGNVRELEHTVERAIIFSEGDEIQPKDLNLPNFKNDNPEKESEPDIETFKLEEIEKKYIEKALKNFRWNRENSARALGISQKTLYSKIKKYQLSQYD